MRCRNMARHRESLTHNSNLLDVVVCSDVVVDVVVCSVVVVAVVLVLVVPTGGSDGCLEGAGVGCERKKVQRKI